MTTMKQTEHTLKTLYDIQISSRLGEDISYLEGNQMRFSSVIEAHDTIELISPEIVRELVDQVRKIWRTNETTSESLDGLYITHKMQFWLDDQKYQLSISSKTSRSKKLDVNLIKWHPDSIGPLDQRNDSWEWQEADPRVVKLAV